MQEKEMYVHVFFVKLYPQMQASYKKNKQITVFSNHSFCMQKSSKSCIA